MTEQGRPGSLLAMAEGGAGLSASTARSSQHRPPPINLEPASPLSPLPSAMLSSTRTSSGLFERPRNIPFPPAPHSPRSPALHHPSLNFLDPVLDLCPSIEALQRHFSKPDVPESEKSFKAQRAVLRAASNGDVELLGWLLAPNGEARPWIKDLGGRDEDGNSAVLLASMYGHVDCVRLLVQQGADVNDEDVDGWTPLSWATTVANAPLVTFLLSHGADLSHRSRYGTSCEDILVASTPSLSSDASGSLFSSSASGNLRPVSPTTAMTIADREAIADQFHEHNQMKARLTAAERVKLGAREREKAKERARSESVSSILSASAPVSSGSHSSPSPGLPASSSGLPPRPASPAFSVSTSSGTGTGRSLAQRRMATGTAVLTRSERNERAEEALREREINEVRRRVMLDAAEMLEVDYDHLAGEHEEPSPSLRRPLDGFSGPIGGGGAGAGGSGKARELPVGTGPSSISLLELSSFSFDSPPLLGHDMLVFSQHQLPELLDVIVSDAKPVRAPWTARAMPANALFLLARYAGLWGEEGDLEELMLCAVDRLEEIIYDHANEMTYTAFWLFNCTLLMHYLKKDPALSPVSSAYVELLTDLINEIYVLVIRDTERRVDRILDAAVLDHESVPGLQDVRFEGEWRIVKALKNKRGSIIGRSRTSSSPGNFPGDLATDPTSPGRGAPQTTAFVEPHPSPGLSGAGFSGSSRRPMSMIASALSSRPSSTNLLAAPSPHTVTTLLESTLHVLQLYEINPAVVVQVISQVFYWLSCELFNRVLTRKKYVCRSKAIQIRLNVSSIEDWARTNALPLSILHGHLGPLNQLISWLQCQSQLKDFDSLIATMQGLKRLNPLQMRRAVREYRYEVGEGKMEEECVQYLLQLQKDWDQRRVAVSVDNLERNRERMAKAVRAHSPTQHRREGTVTPNGTHVGDSDADEDEQDDATAQAAEPADVMSAEDAAAARAIEELFLPGRSVADYVPPPRPDCLGELLDSRYMLPFSLPKKPEHLAVVPGDAFGFGTGYFTGTGTPNLRRAASPNVPASRPTSPSPMCDLGSGSSSGRRTPVGNGGESYGGLTGPEEEKDGGEDAGLSQELEAERERRIAWQPIPVLPDGFLEKLNYVCPPQMDLRHELRQFQL